MARFQLSMMLAAVAVISSLLWSVSGQSCLESPYLLITFHGGSSGVNTVYKYSRDGCQLSTSVLNGADGDELRSMLFTADGSTLLVASSHKDDSKIMGFGGCASSQPYSFLGDLVTQDDNAGLDHPYGLAEQPVVGSIYTSDQDTNNVLGFTGLDSASPGTPLPIAPGVNASNVYPGTFAQFDPSSNGVRGIVFVRGNNSSVWFLAVASEDDEAVIFFDSNGDQAASIPASSPVGLDFHDATQTLYVSCRDDAQGTAYVMAVDINTLTVTKKYTDPNLQHPAGSVVYGNTLFVIGLDDQAVFTFNLATGTSNGALISNMPDQPEQIVLATC